MLITRAVTMLKSLESGNELCEMVQMEAERIHLIM